MSEKKLDPMEELVDFTAPFDPADSRGDVLLAVNGETVRVKRGETVRLKRKFLEAWDNANAQRAEARRVMEMARQGGKTPLMEM